MTKSTSEGRYAFEKFENEITLCCKLLKTQGKCRGWVFGAIPQLADHGGITPPDRT
jgi:hypothetical protein